MRIYTARPIIIKARERTNNLLDEMTTPKRTGTTKIVTPIKIIIMPKYFFNASIFYNLSEVLIITN